MDDSDFITEMQSNYTRKWNKKDLPIVVNPFINNK